MAISPGEEAECLGACVNAPMVQVGGDTYEDLSPERLSRSSRCLHAASGRRLGPQNGRQFAAPEGGPTTLKKPSETP